MSKQIAQIPFSNISRATLYIGNRKETIDQAKASAGCDLIINAEFYDTGTGKAVGHLKSDGKVLAAAPWTIFGFAWDSGSDFHMAVLPDATAENYISGVELLTSGKGAGAKLSYLPEVGGVRGRTAVMVAGDKLVLYCSGDGSKDAKTPEALRDELVEIGGKYATPSTLRACMWDCGGSSQCDFGGGKRISTGRKVHGYFCVWLKKAGNIVDENGIIQKMMTRNPCYTKQEKKAKSRAMLHSTATPGATAQNIFDSWNKSTTNAGVEFIIDNTGIYQTLPLGIKSWHAGASANNTHVACEICEPEETIFLPINWRELSQGGQYNKAYAVKRLQQELVFLGFDPKGVDGSFGPGCAAAVRAYQKSVGMSVDGFVGPATLKYLQKREASYMRYNAALAADYFTQVYGYAVALFAWLMGEMSGKPEEIICHSEGFKLGIASNHADVLHWFPQHGKSMDTFRADVAAAIGGTPTPTDPLGEAVEKLSAAGILNSPDYWKGGNYSAANVQALLIKMADAFAY